MKPLIDAVSGDRREEATTDDEAGRPDCRGARQGGQRGSSCGRHARSGPPHWVGMTSPMGPPSGPSWGPPSGLPCGRQCGPRGAQIGGPSWAPPCGPPFLNGPNTVGFPDCLYDIRTFMYGPTGCGPMRWSTFGPMTRFWGVSPPCADETVDTESDEEHAGKNNGENVSQVSQDDMRVTSEEKTEQQRPWVDRMRRRRLRHGNVDCRRHDPCPMYRRCRRGFGARSHCPPWATDPGDCCQPGARMKWGTYPYPPPFFCQDACDNAGESTSDPENDNQKEDGARETQDASRPLSQGPSGSRDRWRQRCHGNGRGWCCGPPRNKLYQMLSWKRKVLKGKLQRIESHLERLRPSEDEAKEATMGEDVCPEQASSMSQAREAASSMDTHVEERAERE